MNHKRKIRFLFEDVSTFEGKILSLFLLFLNFVFITIYIAGSYPVPEVVSNIFWNIEVIISFIFLIEYLLRVYSSNRGIKKLSDPLMIADLLAIFPVFLILLYQGSYINAGFLRVFRVFRVFRFFRITKSKEFIWGKISRSDLEITRLLLIIFTVFFVSAGFFYEFEVGLNPGINSFSDSFYYTVTTLTTVGFGDITPVTLIGKWITILSLLGGIIIIPWEARKIVNTWSSQNKRDIECPNCGLEKHESDASYCKDCGHQLEQTNNLT